VIENQKKERKYWNQRKVFT